VKCHPRSLSSSYQYISKYPRTHIYARVVEREIIHKIADSLYDRLTCVGIIYYCIFIRIICISIKKKIKERLFAWRIRHIAHKRARIHDNNLSDYARIYGYNRQSDMTFSRNGVGCYFLQVCIYNKRFDWTREIRRTSVFTTFGTSPMSRRFGAQICLSAHRVHALLLLYFVLILIIIYVRHAHARTHVGSYRREMKTRVFVR